MGLPVCHRCHRCSQTGAGPCRLCVQLDAPDGLTLRPEEVILLRFLEEYGGWMGADLIAPILSNVLRISDERLAALEAAGLTRFEDGAEKLHLTDAGRAAIQSAS